MDTPTPPFPELFADGIQVTHGPFGVTLTLLLVEPPRPGQPPAPRARIAGRLRMAPQLAEALGKALTAPVTEGSPTEIGSAG